MSTEDLVTWLRAQLDEDERLAQAADPKQVRAIVAANMGSFYSVRHIALHDPARVLREVEAKRAVLDLYEAMLAGFEAAAEGTILAGAAKVRLGAYELAVQHLASAYSDHPGYREEWKL